MQKLKIAALATIMGLASLLGALAPQVAKADATWQSTVLASTAQVRFEATPTGYDAASNKYKYQFSWLMPKYRAYSFKIDGKMYNGRVTQNGVAETPFWFSPDITYTIQIYPYANGRGNVLAQGTFTAPSVAAPTTSDLTTEEEYQLIYEYVLAAPKYPTKTITSKSDVIAIFDLIEDTFSIPTFAETRPYFSSKSLELLNRTPLYVKELNDQTSDSNSTLAKVPTEKDVKVYKGGQYASFSYKMKDGKTGKVETSKMFFIKENGSWKLDYIQLIKVVIEESLKQ